VNEGIRVSIIIPMSEALRAADKKIISQSWSINFDDSPCIDMTLYLLNSFSSKIIDLCNFHFALIRLLRDYFLVTFAATTVTFVVH
jgi:hypothetical protein